MGGREDGKPRQKSRKVASPARKKCHERSNDLNISTVSGTGSDVKLCDLDFVRTTNSETEQLGSSKASGFLLFDF